MGGVFSSIGHGISAVISAIANVLLLPSAASLATLYAAASVAAEEHVEQQQHTREKGGGISPSG
ncbi:hypothetical protein FRC17_003682 [Serendipita sp. 399]|nr:hypothetical protein FRC17_003682 [Serendipita sp. 399]